MSLSRKQDWRDIIVEIEPSDPNALRQWHRQKRRERWSKRIGWALVLLLAVAVVRWLHGLGEEVEGQVSRAAPEDALEMDQSAVKR